MPPLHTKNINHELNRPFLHMQRATRGPAAPPLVGRGGPCRGGGSYERQRDYAGVKLRPNSMMICSITREKETKKTNLRLISLRYNQ